MAVNELWGRLVSATAGPNQTSVRLTRDVDDEIVEDDRTADRLLLDWGYLSTRACSIQYELG
jgi:hypothetical protein